MHAAPTAPTAVSCCPLLPPLLLPPLRLLRLPSLRLLPPSLRLRLLALCLLWLLRPRPAALQGPLPGHRMQTHPRTPGARTRLTTSTRGLVPPLHLCPWGKLGQEKRLEDWHRTDFYQLCSLQRVRFAIEPPSTTVSNQGYDDTQSIYVLAVQRMPVQ